MFLNYLNNKHGNIEFTVEHEVNNTLPFLDVCITKDNNKLITDVYRKNTFTGLGLNYFSHVPHLFKMNSISTLIYRAYNICNTWNNFNEEINRLKQYFANNCYPNNLVDKMVKRFLNNKFDNTSKNSVVNNEIKYITLPFQGHFSYYIRNKLQRLLKLHFPDINFRFIFTNSLTVGSFFKHKDRMPDKLCSKVVYEYCCPVCKDRYIGSTTRNLKIRIAEHKGISYRSNMQLSNPNVSMIREHSRDRDHLIKEDNFNILFRANNASDLRIAETLFIIEHKPNLNSHDSAIKLNVV